MLMWLCENLSTIIISAVLLAVVAVICFSMISNRRKGKSSCGCSCKDCALSQKCHGKK